MNEGSTVRPSGQTMCTEPIPLSSVYIRISRIRTVFLSRQLQYYTLFRVLRYRASIWLLTIPVSVRWREKQVKCPTSGNFYCPRDTVPLNSYRIEEEGLSTWHCPFKHLPNRGGGSAAAHRAILKQEGISRWGGGGEGGEGGLEAWLVVAGSNPKPLETVH